MVGWFGWFGWFSVVLAVDVRRQSLTLLFIAAFIVVVASFSAALHFETMAMKEKIKELEAKDAASKESERTQMNQLIQREKELEKLRMDQWREKSAMMEKMKRVKEEHDKKLKEIIDEKNMQNVEKEQKVKEEEERKMNEASEMKTLSKQAHAADQRAGKHAVKNCCCCERQLLGGSLVG